MSQFLPETNGSTVAGAAPDLGPEQQQRDIKNMQTVLATAAKYPQQIPSDFLGLIADSMSVSNLLVPLSQVVGFPQQGRPLDHVGGVNDIANIALVRVLYAPRIGPGILGVDRCLRVTMFGDCLYNNNTVDTLKLTFKYGPLVGATTFFEDTVADPAALSATRRPWIWEAWVMNLGATNSQWVASRFSIITSSATTGIGDYRDLFRAAPSASAGGVTGTSTLGTIDTTVKTFFTFSVQWSAANANNSFRKYYAMTELI